MSTEFIIIIIKDYENVTKKVRPEVIMWIKEQHNIRLVIYIQLPRELVIK